MKLERKSPCKVNLLLNILGKRPDGFHELETILQPVALHDEIIAERSDSGAVELTCSDPSLTTGPGNLVYRAAAVFRDAAKIKDGVKIHLEKRIPMAAGLGGGSGNAAATLLALNELFGQPLSFERLNYLAALLGSDVPFFLQSGPGIGTGRGEQIHPLPPFAALQGASLLLIHPGFGIATAWAYQQLQSFPAALNGQPGRAEKLVKLLQGTNLSAAMGEMYNSLEAPAFHKHPILEMYQEFLREAGAAGVLMSGSGSTTFAIFSEAETAARALEQFKSKFGRACWAAIVPLS